MATITITGIEEAFPYLIAGRKDRDLFILIDDGPREWIENWCLYEWLDYNPAIRDALIQVVAALFSEAEKTPALTPRIIFNVAEQLHKLTNTCDFTELLWDFAVILRAREHR